MLLTCMGRMSHARENTELGHCKETEFRASGIAALVNPFLESLTPPTGQNRTYFQPMQLPKDNYTSM